MGLETCRRRRHETPVLIVVVGYGIRIHVRRLECVRDTFDRSTACYLVTSLYGGRWLRGGEPRE